MADIGCSSILKTLTNLCYRYFKMESVQNVLKMIQKDAWMASIDLKDPLHPVPVPAKHQKYLHYFASEYLKFKWIPNGYIPAMKIFINITKVQCSILRVQGHKPFVYVYYSYLQGDSYESCLKNINFRDMSLKLTKKKKWLYHHSTKFFEKSKPTIQFVTQVFGNIVATFPSVPLAALFYRALETDKIVGLKRYSQNYGAKTKLSNEPWYELVSWKQITKNSF